MRNFRHQTAELKAALISRLLSGFSLSSTRRPRCRLMSEALINGFVPLSSPPGGSANPAAAPESSAALRASVRSSAEHHARLFLHIPPSQTLTRPSHCQSSAVSHVLPPGGENAERHHQPRNHQIRTVGRLWIKSPPNQH